MKKSGNNNQANSEKQGEVIEGELIDKESVPAKESADEAKQTAAAAAKADSSKQKSSAAASKAKQASEKPAKQGATWPGKLALLLAFIAVAGVGYLYWLQLQSGEKLNASQQQANASVQTAISNSQQQINQKIGAVNQQISGLKSDSEREKTSITELQDRLTKSIQQVTSQQQNTRKDWLLAEVEYLLRLANQRVLMEQTPQGALQLLRSADKILSETDDVTIYDVRKAVAADIAALEAIPELDTEGVFLRLGALNTQVENLQVIPLTEQHKLPEIMDQVASDEFASSLGTDIRVAWAKVAEKFDQLVVVQHRDEPVEPLLSPQQSYYLQQNLHLMLEQAQLSLLQRKPRSYLTSLEKAEGWIGTYFEQKHSNTQALLKALAQLKQIEVAPKMPDISGSLVTLKEYLQQMRKLKEKGAA